MAIQTLQVVTNLPSAEAALTVAFGKTATDSSVTITRRQDGADLPPVLVKLPMSPKERAAASALRQAVEGVDLVAAGFSQWTGDAAPIGVKRVIIDGAQFVDIPLDLSSGQPSDDLPSRLRHIAKVSVDDVNRYLQVASTRAPGVAAGDGAVNEQART